MAKGSDSHPSPLVSHPARLVTAPVVTAPVVSDPGPALREALGAAYALRPVERSTQRRTHLDTVDRRLRDAGLSLTQTGGRLSARRGVEPPLVQDLGSTSWPALADELPRGPVADLVTGAASIRALIPFAVIEARSTTFAALNGDGKTVARVAWTEGDLVDPLTAPLGVMVEVRALRGYGVEAEDIGRRLAEAGLAVAAGEPWVDAVVAATDAARPSTRRFGMGVDQPADLAVADALLGYLAEMEARVDGVIADIDTEYLHDFRVAVRRTRSVLKLLGDVLPIDVSWAVEEFRRLGDITTPTRDLDVYLLGMDGMRAAVSRPADLDPFEEYVRARRKQAHVDLADALNTSRFGDLSTCWRSQLAGVIAAPTNSPVDAADLARNRIEHTFHQVASRARAIKSHSPSARVHALRKKCKELRYLMEVFRPLCDPGSYKRVIADFKELQQVLGDFQDGEVQAGGLREFAAEMVRGGAIPVDTLLAMGQLSAEFDARQQRARAELDAHHESYLGTRAANHVALLVPAGNP